MKPQLTPTGLNKQQLVSGIYLNQLILTELELAKIAHENIFTKESRYNKRLNRQIGAFQEVIDGYVDSILNILEEESL